MNTISDYRRSAFAVRAFRLSWLLGFLPVAVIAIYMMTHPSRDSVAILLFVLLLIYAGSVIILNIAAVLYWLGDRLPGGFRRLAAIMWPVALLASLWLLSEDYIYDLVDFLLFDYAVPVALTTLVLMSLFIVVVRLSLWVVDGFREHPAAVDHKGE